nr:hypothetical protein [Tanacetum cinerariifolium]
MVRATVQRTAKKDDPKEVKETPKEWIVEEEIALCQGWCDVLENSILGNSMKAKGFWEAVSSQGRKKSKTSETILGSASGGLNLNEEADEAVKETQEFRPMGNDRANAKKKATGSSCGGASSFVYLEAEARKIAQLKREKLEIQRRTLELAERKKRTEMSYSIIQQSTRPCPQYNKRSWSR